MDFVSERMRRGAPFLLCATVLAACAPAWAESVFAQGGVGEWLEGYDLRGEALGGTGIGTIDAMNTGAPNPAAAAFAEHAQGQAAIFGGTRWADDDANRSRRIAALIGLGVNVPLPGKLGFQLSMRQQTDRGYFHETSLSTGFAGDEGNLRRMEGSRGLMRYSGAFTVRPHDAWALGAELGVLSGSLLDELATEFVAPAAWSDTHESATYRIEPALVWSVGFQARPISRVSLGGFLSMGSEASVQVDRTAAGGTTIEDKMQFESPVGYGGGLALRIAERVRLMADVITRQWEDVTMVDHVLPYYNFGPYRSTTRWGIGLERMRSTEPRTRFWNRTAYRIGFAYIPWYILDASGEGIDEWRVSAGLGLPVQKDRGSIDLLLAYGQRGTVAENGLKEEYIRFGCAFTFARVLREY